jgi:5-methylcytosine-specific restriction endonuclease McrA
MPIDGKTSGPCTGFIVHHVNPLSRGGEDEPSNMEWKARRTRVSSCSTCVRDANGRIKRSPAARAAFRRDNPCPATGETRGACPGYVIDHIKALKRGGADEPANMQWQTTAAAKAKDRIE